MAWIVGDSFDFYTTAADAATFWDISSSFWNLVTGRFSGSRAMGNNQASQVDLTKASGSNDVTHHIVCAFEQTTPITGSTSGRYFQLLDGTVGQVCVVFRSDGAILLTSGTTGGTVLATYTGAFVQNVWAGFEFEITINNTTGAFHVRKDGATSDSFVATGLNTRPGTNAWANKLQVGNVGNVGTANGHIIEDLLWFSTSGAVPNTWVGDVRAVQLMPTADTATKAFSASAVTITPFVADGTHPLSAGNGTMGSFTASVSGTVSSVVVQLSSGGTGNLKAAIYSGSGVVLATSGAIVNPVTGANTFSFSPPLSVTKGTTYNLAFDADITIVYFSKIIGSPGSTFVTSYASFPAASPAFTALQQAPIFSVVVTPTVNAEVVGEAQQDGDTSFLSDSVVGHNDLYDMADLPTSPLTVVAVQTRGLMRKSDAGTRAGQVQIKSGTTTVTTAPLTLATGYQWVSRVDTVDPNTSAAWSGTAINAIQLGPVVQA